MAELMKKSFILSLFFLVSACVTNTFLYTDEKGNQVYQVTCNGVAHTYGDCLAEIGRRCPAGFNILMSQEKQTGSMTDRNISGNYSGYSSANAGAFGNGTGAMASGFGQSFGNLGMSGNSMTMGMFNRYIIYNCKAEKSL